MFSVLESKSAQLPRYVHFRKLAIVTLLAFRYQEYSSMVQGPSRVCDGTGLVATVGEEN